MVLPPCPVCGFSLRGTASDGYRCVKCHAHYSTRFVRQCARAQFRDVIAKHFDPPLPTPPAVPASLHEEEARSTLLFEDADNTVQHALVQAKEAARSATAHLEDFLEVTLPQHPREFLGTPSPTTLLQPRPQSVQYTPQKITGRRKPVRTKARVVKKVVRKKSSTRHRR
jgi:hypothetical protein